MTDQTDAPPQDTRHAADDTAVDVTIVSCVADEAPYLLEWIAWHVLVGAARFVIFSRASSDGTDAMLDRLSELGPLQHHRLEDPPDDKPVFRAALEAAAELPAVAKAEWVLPILPDEFLDITIGHGTLADLLDATEANRADGLALPWRVMGSNGQVGFDPAPVTERFRRGSRIDPPEAPGLHSYRSLYRPTSFTRPGPYRPWGPPTGVPHGKGKGNTPRQVWLNASGDDATAAFRDQKWRDQNHYPPAALAFDYACVRRYAVKSRAEFLHRQLRVGIPAEGGRAPEGWNAWLLRDINSVAMPPLGPAVLREAIAELEGDPALADIQDRARDRLLREVANLTESQPAAQLFFETGDTRDPPAPALAGAAAEETQPRFLCIATHPRAGTVWLRRAMREAAKAMDVPRIEVNGLFDLKALPSVGPAILMNYDGSFPRPLFAMEEARLIHIVRDPRDMLISAAQFHPVAPRKGYPDLHELRPEFQGMSYQEFMKALPDDLTRLAFEMDHRHADVAESMMAWVTGRANTLELRYEDLIADVDCARFAAALAWAGVDGIDANTMLASYWKHALFGGLAQSTNVDAQLRRLIQSGQPERWRREMPRDLARRYAAAHGPLLRALGYASDDAWVDTCPTATEIAAAGAARSATQAG
ncbi:MAG: glycosyltransferase family 2 protein [Pseudomonadota bacterium]